MARAWGPRGRQPVLSLAVLCAICLAAAGQIGLPIGVLRVPVGIVATVFAPGYCALQALRLPRLARIPLAILSVPLSLALMVIVAVVLDVTPVGVRPLSVAVILEAMAVPLLVLDCRRGRHAFRRVLRAARTRRVPGIDGARAALMVTALAGVLVWTGYGLQQASRDDPPPFTELSVHLVGVSMPGPDGRPHAIVRLTIRNMETRTERYRLQIVRRPPNRHALLLSERVVRLVEGASWEGLVAARFICGDHVETQLYLGARTIAYRLVSVRPICASTASHHSRSREARNG